MVKLVNLELDIFLDRKPVNIDYYHTFSFNYTSNVALVGGGGWYKFSGPTKLQMFSFSR